MEKLDRHKVERAYGGPSIRLRVRQLGQSLSLRTTESCLFHLSALRDVFMAESKMHLSFISYRRNQRQATSKTPLNKPDKAMRYWI